MSLKRTFILLSALLVLVGSAFAQATLGSLKGRVLDDSGALVPGATVTVTNGRTTRTVTSIEDGSFTIVGLPSGTYTVKVTAPGLGQLKPQAVDVNAGAVASLDIALRVQAEAQQVTVQDTTNTQLSTDPSSNAGALVLKGEDLAALSDDPDDLEQDLQALAGPAAGPNGGQIYIDGFTGGRLPPKESIREIRINQNPFSAEYDKLGFGRIEIFTKPGSDKYHGMASFSISDGIFNSRNPFSTNKPDYMSKQYSANFSGPLGKKASFFLDYERRDIDDNAVINAIDLDPNLNPQTVALGIVTPQHRTTYSPRIDYQLTPNVTLMARYTFTQSEQLNNGVGQLNLLSQATNSDMNMHSVQLTETQIIGAKAVNETRFQFFRQDTSRGAPFLGPTINVAGSFVGGGSPTGLTFDNENHYELQNYTSITHGTHLFRFGGRVRGIQVDNQAPSGFNGTFTFAGGQGPQLDANNQPTGQTIPLTSIEQYRRTLLFQQLGYSFPQIQALGGGPSQFTIAGGQPLVGVNQVDVGIFAQDDWRLKPNITLSLGLRYETQTNISDWRDLAPRIGIAWAPGVGAKGGRPKFVIRAGTGIFYDRFDDTYVLNAQRFNGINQQQYQIRNPGFFSTTSVPSVAELQAQARPVTTDRVDARLRAPYIIQSAIGFERQLPFNTTLAVTFTNSRGLHLLASRNINAPVPGSNVIPYPTAGPIDLYQSTGILNQNQINTNINTRMTSRISMFIGYSWNTAKSNTDGAGTFPANQYDASTEYGRAAIDVQNRFTLGGSIEAKYRIRLSPFIIASSGRPFNITTGSDVNGDQIFTDRPAFATSAQVGQPGIVATRFGIFNTLPGPNEVIIPRNYGDGPGSFTVNLRLSRTFGFGPERAGGPAPVGDMGGGGGGGDHGGRGGGGGGRGGGGGGMRMGGGGGRGGGGATSSRRYNLIVSANARNLMNHTNYGPFNGSLSSPFFGVSNSLGSSFHGGTANNRGIDFSLRFIF
jgi:hypothetical protein